MHLLTPSKTNADEGEKMCDETIISYTEYIIIHQFLPATPD
jgi:hypothetical protein